jgi:hypothetical protein
MANFVPGTENLGAMKLLKQLGPRELSTVKTSLFFYDRFCLGSWPSITL